MTTYRFGGETATGMADLLNRRAGLVSLANRFYRQARDCHSFDEEEELTGCFLSKFMEGIFGCFACEEELMAETYYPDREEHRQEHDDFVERLYALRRRHKLGEPVMAIEIFFAIREWFLEHWEYADGRLLLYLDRTTIVLRRAETGVAPEAVPA